MLTQETVVDKVEALENGCIQVRTITRVANDGNVIAQSYHRHVVCPGDDFSAEDHRVKAICAAIHTPECIAAYKAATWQQGA